MEEGTLDEESEHVAVVSPLWVSVSLFANHDADLNDPNGPLRGNIPFLTQHVGLEEVLIGSE